MTRPGNTTAAGTFDGTVAYAIVSV